MKSLTTFRRKYDIHYSLLHFVERIVSRTYDAAWRYYPQALVSACASPSPRHSCWCCFSVSFQAERMFRVRGTSRVYYIDSAGQPRRQV